MKIEQSARRTLQNRSRAMQITGCLFSILSVLILLGATARAEIESDHWAVYRFLLGQWSGEGSGQPGQAKGEFSFALELGGKVMVRRNRAEISRGPDRPPAVHEDLMVIYPGEQGQPPRAIYFDSEGHVIQYTVRPSEKPRALTFLNEPSPSAPRFRLTYTEQDNEKVAIAFAMAPPGNPDAFKTYLEGTAQRKPRSNVGLSLPRGYVSYRTTEPITIDGKLDEKAWQAAPWTDAFVDIEGDLKPLPRHQTRAKMLWDDQYFYVAAHLEEPHVWGTLTQHDAVIFQDNDFEIFIDPDGDNHEYYEIEINALNTEWDLFLKKPYRDGGPAVNAWEIPGLRTAVHVEGTLNDARDKDQFWSVEFAIPWKVLAEFAHRPAPPRDDDQWRINFSRVEWQHELEGGKYRKVPSTHEDNWVWSPQGVIDMHRPESWGIVQFSTAAPGSASFHPDPAGPVRDRLIEVYHAQKRFHDKYKRWAERIEVLDLPTLPAGSPEHKVTIEATPNGFEAAITFTPEGSDKQMWTIRQDSRIARKP
jgi:hypothetical protein